MEFGVSNLGTSDVFLGHDWLKHHNPEIDWKGKMIQFNRCPGSCYKEEIGTDPEDDVSSLLEEGEQLLAVHLGGEEINIRTKTTYLTGQFQVEVDASDFAMGGILSQHQKDDTW